MSEFLEKKVAKFTLDVSGAYTDYVTNGLGGSFAAADIDEDNDTITITDHGFKTGDHVGLLVAGSGAAPTAPALATSYYIIYVDKDTVAVATSLSNAKSGTKAALTADSAADCYLVPHIYGTIKSNENDHNLIIPSGAIITDAWIDVVTTFQSDDSGIGDGNADDATIAIGVESSGDLVAAAGIGTSASAGTPGNVWDAGQHGTLAGSPALDDGESEIGTISNQTALVFGAKRAENFIETTDDNPIEIAVANDAYLHKGKMHIYVEYVA